MRPTRCLALAAVGISAAFPRASLAQSSSGSGRFVYAGAEVILPAPPMLVASGDAVRADWSSDGRYVLAVQSVLPSGAPIRLPPPLETVLVLWTRGTGRATELWRASDTGSGPPQEEWLPGTAVAFVLIDQQPPPPAGAADGLHRWLYRVDASRASLRPVARVAKDSSLLIGSTSPVAALLSLEERAVRILQRDGTTRHLTRFPEGVQPIAGFWPADDKELIVETAGLNPEGVPAFRPGGAFAVDPETGRIAPRQGELQPVAPKEPSLPIRLRHTEVILKEGKAIQRVRPLWLESGAGGDHTLALVVSDAAWGRLSPDGGAVLYATEGATWVMPLLRLPRQTFVDARNAAQRSVVVSNARQLGLGLRMYEGDHQTLPGPDADLRSLLLPYVKRDEFFEGFVYQHPGGPLTAITEPAKTLLGYIPGPGGRAQLFADGHVEWRAD